MNANELCGGQVAFSTKLPRSWRKLCWAFLKAHRLVLRTCSRAEQFPPNEALVITGLLATEGYDRGYIGRSDLNRNHTLGLVIKPAKAQTLFRFSNTPLQKRIMESFVDKTRLRLNDDAALPIDGIENRIRNLG